MKTLTNHRISLLQHVCITSGFQISVAIIALPRKLAEAAGTDGWLAIPMMWALSAAASLIIIQIMKQHDGTVLDIITHYMGAWMGKAAALLFALYFLILGYDGITRALLITKTWLLPSTSTFITMVLFLIPAYMISRFSIQIIGRYAELVFLISLWIPFIYMCTIGDAHILNILPVLKGDVWHVVSAVKEIIYPSLGMVSSFFIYPYLARKELASAGLIAGTTLTMTIYLLITVLCFIYFSPDEITQYNDPIISILKSIEFQFIERIEVPFIAFYLFIFSLVWMPSIYLTSYCLSRLFHLKDHITILRIVCISIAVGSFFFVPTYNQSNFIEEQLNYLGLAAEYILPACLLGYIILRKGAQRRSRS